MKREGPLAGHRQARRPVLRWKTPDGRGQECPVTPDRPVTIGRESRNTIALDSRAVSKAHAIIELRNGEFTVQDLESANGTRVNGEPTLVRVLEPGDEVQVGDVILSFMDLGGDVNAVGATAEPSGGMKFLKLAGAASLTMIVMIGAMMTLLNPGARSAGPKAQTVEAPLAPASVDLVAALRASAESSLPVQETLKTAALTGVPPAMALFEEGLLRIDNKRWREAAQLMAATLARDAKHPRAATELDRVAAELDRAASKALAAAEQAQSGLQFEDAQLRADEVLLMLDASDPRHARAAKIAEQARVQLRER